MNEQADMQGTQQAEQSTLAKHEQPLAPGGLVMQGTPNAPTEPTMPARPNQFYPMASGLNMTKLNVDNFLPWKRQVTIALTLRGLERAILDDDVPAMTDMGATMVLLDCMDDSHKLQVQAEPTAKKIMA